MLSMRCVQALKLFKCEFSKEDPHFLRIVLKLIGDLILIFGLNLSLENTVL
jgi:hypothetical protein